MTASDEGAGRALPVDRLVTWWRSFRGWRRSRPFWGGLLLILSGVELLAIPLASVLARSSIKLVVYIGIGGVFGLIIGGLLIACGVLIWVHPGPRVFYSIAAVLLAVTSFIVTNLGGFFIGMLLGVIGGSLAFGWVPDGAARRGHRRPPVIADSVIADSDGAVAADSDGRGARGLLAAAAPVLLLAPALMAHGAAARPASKCIIPVPILCPAPPSPTPSPSPSPSPTQPPGQPSPTPAPSGPAPSPSSSPSGSPSASPSSSPTASASPRPRRARKVRKASSVHAPAPALQISGAPFSLVTGSAVLKGSAYLGVAHVPTAGGRRIAMMKFSLSSLTLSGDPTLTVRQGGAASSTSAASMQFTGSVVLYATKLSGDLLGAPITLTPDSPLSLVLRVLGPVTPGVTLTLTNVTTDEPYISTASLQIGSLDSAAAG